MKAKFKERGSAIYQLFMLVLSVYVMCVLILETFVVKDDQVIIVLRYIDLFICCFFMLDFFVNLFTAKNKLAYLKWGWIDFIASIPMLDSLRWGRISRIIRIIRFIRSIKSIKKIYREALDTKVESLTFVVILITFVAYTLCASLILYFEQNTNPKLDTAQEALWWAFLNIMNAKVNIVQSTTSSAGQFMTILLNKIGLLLFAYLNGIIITWLVQKKSSNTSPA